MSLIHCKGCGETHDADSTCARPPLAGRTGSAIGFCVDCRYWEPLANGIGFCPLFQKRTEELHGTQCTALWRKLPNAPALPRREEVGDE
jgi:hypothetical protein